MATKREKWLPFPFFAHSRVCTRTYAYYPSFTLTPYNPPFPFLQDREMIGDRVEEREVNKTSNIDIHGRESIFNHLIGKDKLLVFDFKIVAAYPYKPLHDLFE